MCLSRFTFHSEKLIWAASSTLDWVCLGGSSSSKKGEGGSRNKNRVSAEPALPMTGDWPVAEFGARGPSLYQFLGSYLTGDRPAEAARHFCRHEAGPSWMVLSFAPPSSSRPASERRKPAPEGAASQSRSRVAHH